MSPVSRKAVEAITELNAENEPIGGRLGIPIGGIRQVNVANRPGFVYVRLRDNPNELVQAFNDSVSAVYDLPVLVEFKNNRYVVTGRDTDRYSSWGSDSSYIPAHASQHSMLANQLGGGDPVFVDGRQMMPGAAYPSGTLGGPNVLVSDFLFRNKLGNWLYVGNTGTPNLNTLRPNGSNARMVLVCLDYTSGGFVILTGSTFSATLTGTSQIWPYIPNNNLDQVPLAAIRIVSGTTSIGWDNIYDARQWIDSGFLTGSSGGGGGTPGGSNTNVQFNNAGAFGGTNAFAWNGSTGLYIGAPGTLPRENGLIDLVAQGPGSIPSLQFWQFGPSAAPTIIGNKSNGTYLVPSAVLQNDELIGLWARGFDSSNWTDQQGAFQFIADETWTITGVGTRAQMYITPRGSTTLTLVQDWEGSFVNIYKPLNMNTHFIHNVVDPLLNQDAATKKYVDDSATTVVTGTGLTISGHQISLAAIPYITFLTDSNEFYRASSLTATPFSGTINGAPSGATLVYTPTAGNESDLAQQDGTGAQTANNLTAVVLRNTTRGEELLVSNVNLGTNTITFTTNVPGTWVNGDVITTNAGLGSNFRAAEIKNTSVIPSSASQILLELSISDTAGSIQAWLQGYETFVASKTTVRGHTPGANLLFTGILTLPLISRRILHQVRSPAGNTALLVLRVAGYQ